MAQKSLRNQKRTKRAKSAKSTMMGGAGAAAHAIAVYGDANAQHAVEGSNVIAAQPLPEQAPAQAGGAVCADGIEREICDETVNTVVPVTEPAAEPVVLQQTEGGAIKKLSKKEMAKLGGSGLLETLAAPAVLLYANQKYGKASQKKYKGKKLRKSARIARK